MYYPYLRGKQNELITVRDNAELLSGAGFIPIIEPVKESTSGLKRALDAVIEAGGQAIVIVNPQHGDFSGDGDNRISDFIDQHYLNSENIVIGILLEEDTELETAARHYERHIGHTKSFIHAGFTNSRGLLEHFDDMENILNVFIDGKSSRLYRRHFQGTERVLVRDGFKRRNNREYPEVELFSDLHITYEDEGMVGFGDFLIAGDEYRESGGPAYAVAIHMTCIDETQDGEMHIHHFKSYRQDTPTDPAGKFAEALGELIAEVDDPDTNILETNAVAEYRDLSPVSANGTDLRL